MPTFINQWVDRMIRRYSLASLALGRLPAGTTAIGFAQTPPPNRLRGMNTEDDDRRDVCARVVGGMTPLLVVKEVIGMSNFP